MDTRFLESFVAVAESPSLAEAARRLHISPATLALRLQTLEAELGFALVARAGRTVTPTPAGLAVVARARGILRDIRDLQTLEEAQSLRGHLRLGVAQTAIATILCDVLPVMAAKYPGVEIAVQKGSSAQIFARLNGGEVDAGLLFHPLFKLPKALRWRAVRSEPFIVIVSGAEAGADAMALMRDRPFIRYDRSLWSGQIADRFLRQHHIRPHERIELDALDAIAILVDRGLGVSLVPDWSPPWPEGLNVRKFALGDAAAQRHLGLLWPVASAHARLIEAVERELLSALCPP